MKQYIEENIIKHNLLKLIKSLKNKNLSMDQAVANGSYPPDYIFFKMICVINSKIPIEKTNIYCTSECHENNSFLKVFNSLKIDKYFESLIKKLENKSNSNETLLIEGLTCKIKRYRHLYKKRFLKSILFFLVNFLNFNIVFSQLNMADKDIKLLTSIENTVFVNISLADVAYSMQLPDLPDGAYITTACDVNKIFNPISYTSIGIRENKNLFFTIYFSLILDKYGYTTESAYVGYIKRQYGEPKTYIIKTKKIRIYPENNIYTEIIKLDNGIILTIENKMFVKKIKLPNSEEFEIKDYLYRDCHQD
jgi:hypothetical protein